jgi:predicted phage replisome organizer
MSDTKKYYWLKLKRDFFKRHDIKIIESQDNGKDYVLFYLKLLLESVDHNGELRFSETVPYNDKMLATITDTNIDIVRSAVKIFSELGMMDRFDDGTLYMEQVNTMLGFETSDAIRMRELREKKTQLLIEHGDGEQCSKVFKNRSPELELDKELDKEIKKEDTPEIPAIPSKPKKEKKQFIPPTQEEVINYVLEKQLVISPYEFFSYYSKLDWKDVQGNQVKSWKGKAVTWDSRDKNNNPDKLPYSETLNPDIKTSTAPTFRADCCGTEVDLLLGFCKVCGKQFKKDGTPK